MGIVLLQSPYQERQAAYLVQAVDRRFSAEETVTRI